MKFRIIIFIATITILVLTSCQQGTPDAAPPEAVLIAAERALSEETGVAEEDTIFEDVEEYAWPDSCLGLPEEDEMCAQVITDGWRFIYRTDGVQYEVRTDETGANVRIQELNSGE